MHKMINETDLHRLIVSEGGTTPGFFIRQALRIPPHLVQDMKYNLGNDFARVYTSGFDFEALMASTGYWKFWCQAWYHTDYEMCGLPAQSMQVYELAHRNLRPRAVEAFKIMLPGFIAEGKRKLKEGGVK